MEHALHLFGVVHLDRRSKVAAEVTSALDRTDADALFVEFPERLAPRTFARALVRAPAATLGYLLVSLVVVPLYLLFARTYGPTEFAIATDLDRSVPVHHVDRSLLAYGADAGLAASAANWLLVLATGALTPVSAASVTVALLLATALVAFVARRSRPLAAVVGTAALAGGVALATLVPLPTPVWFLLATVLAFEVLTVRTLGARNRHMLGRVEALSAAAGYESSVLLTGRAHLPGMLRLAVGPASELDVRWVHRSRWLRSGTVRRDPEPPARANRLGRLGDVLGRGGVTTHPADDPPGLPASLRRRAAASVLDLVGLPVVAFVAGVGLGVVGAALPVEGATGVGVEAGLLLGGLGYFPLFEWYRGQTPGKVLLGIAVSDADGTPPALWRVLVRNALRPVDFLVCYALGALVAGVTSERQRVGDLLAGTVVRETVSGD
ncbi:RDD family protein [Halomarina ordinaria]|uniref:RDD family protein n=1 Tax=Halomarina ordinaria TaxID=3033939 RepID=A0ABD5U6W8_9EURY|nr:RDD family protein [Halomarina sp. PSRA2]